MIPHAIFVVPHDLARRGDAEGFGVRGAGNIDGREHAPLIEKAVRPRAIEVVPHDLATRIDVEGYGGRGAGNINGREHAPVIEKAMHPKHAIAVVGVP